MPLTRYQIRSEYGFADPELYRAADKDDPEALLEGVAMAGLVGVLRQLGDLAEFAAEIFHDLHEEVLATASRGHGLMIRVQQLETEFPLIEKALLSQTNHPSFFCNAGVDWHPNMHSQQNLISQGDLPRFIMDSYEECRAPPRLFLLDKFDVAGAGACLKRYSDPSFFRIEAAVDEVQRERKMRRVKKKGIRGRNGETPEVMPASHAKLQQLFLEESIENSFSNNPARLVKLKKRPLKESPFCSKSGKSYMEKFVEIPSPESKTVCEVPVAPQSLKWTTGNGNESDHQVLDLNMLSPKKTLSEEEGTSRSIRQALSQKSSPGRMDGMVCNQKEMEDPEPTPYNYINESATLHEAAEKELIDVEGEVGQGIDSWNSDEITSEVENYMDALATMESETETDNEYRAKKPKAFSSNRRDTDSETNEEQTELQAQFSDSQSLGYSASDDGNTSLIKGSSSFSYSDSQGNVVENVASDAEGNATGFVNTETSASGFLSVASNQLSAHEETSKIEESHEPLVPKHTGREDDEISDLGESSIISCPTDLNLKLSHSFQGQSLLVESASNGIAAVTTDADRRKKDDTVPTVATESHPTIELGDAGAPSSILELPPGPKSSNSHEEELYDEHEGADHTRIMTNREMSAPCCDLSSLEGQPQFLVLSEPNEPPDLKSLTDSSVASLTCNLDVANLHSANSETDAPPISGKVNLESSVVHEDNEQTDLQERQSISLACDFPVERNSQDADVQQQEEIVKFANNAQVVVAMSVNKTSSTKEAVEDNAVALDFPFSPLSDDNVNIDDAVGQETPLEALGLSTSVIGVTDDEGRNSVNLITDTMRSPLMDFNDPASEFEILSLQKCHSGSNPSLSDSISHLETGSETGMDSSFLEQFSTKFAPDDFRTGLGISELGKEELQSKPSPDGYPTCYREDVPSSNIYEKVDLEETVDQRSDEQAHELDVNLSCEEDDKEGSQSLCLQSGQVQSSDSIDTEKCVDASESCSKDQPEQSPSLGVDSTTSVSPQSDAAEVNLEEVLLLPPSPPSERGLGKFSFPLLQQSLPVEGNFPYQISASEGGLGQDLHPQINVEDEKLQFEPQKDNLTLSCPSPLQSQVLDDCSLIQYKTSMVEATDVPNHLPTNVPSEHAFPESGREMVQSNFKCISSDLAVEDGLCRQDPRPSEVEVIQATQSSPAASSEDKVQQHCSNKLEVVHESSIDVSEPSLKQNEHLQHDLLKSDGERAVEATSTQTEVEVGQQNGSLVNDIPRPPKHLIEAVAAHDRSMLRKVTERIQPQIEPKVTERDSLLEQIRTKSFNLKPAHVTRPSIQGPKTNLRVAAILEKANAIRQAFAGSDEDDDDDSWSDS